MERQSGYRGVGGQNCPGWIVEHVPYSGEIFRQNIFLQKILRTRVWTRCLLRYSSANLLVHTGLLSFCKPICSYWSALIELSSSSVKEANAAVTAVHVREGNSAPTDGKRGPYAKLTNKSHCILLHTVVCLSLPFISDTQLPHTSL